MRGFVVGSLVLVVLYVVVQPRAAGAAAAGGNVLVEGLRRMLSPQVAGIPQRGGRPWAEQAARGQPAAGRGSKTGGLDDIQPRR